MADPIAVDSKDQGRVERRPDPAAGLWAPGRRAATFKAWTDWLLSLLDVSGGSALGLFTLSFVTMGWVALVASILLKRPVGLPEGLALGYSAAVTGYAGYGAVRKWRAGDDLP